MVDEIADGDRGGTASAETQEEKEEVEILNGRYRTLLEAVGWDGDIVVSHGSPKLNNLIISRRTAGKNPEAVLRVVDCWQAADDRKLPLTIFRPIAIEALVELDYTLLYEVGIRT